MEIRPSKWQLSKSFLAVFIIASIVFILICIDLLFFREWDFVQPFVIACFLLVSLSFYIIVLYGFSYYLDKKRLVVARLSKRMYYYYSEIIYIAEEKSRKKKQIIFITNKGHVRYLTFDKEGILLDELIARCNNVMPLEMVKQKFPSAKF